MTSHNHSVRSTELIRTNKSWDGTDLPNYLEGRPEVVAVKYEIPAGQKLGWHHHPVMNHGILVQGELTIVSIDGKEKTVHEGEVVVEMVNTIHHGENRGAKPVILYMFYLSQEGLQLSIQNPAPSSTGNMRYQLPGDASWNAEMLNRIRTHENH